MDIIIIVDTLKPLQKNAQNKTDNANLEQEPAGVHCINSAKLVTRDVTITQNYVKQEIKMNYKINRSSKKYRLQYGYQWVSGICDSILLG